MIKDINTVEGSIIDADICIIGTGAAGITLGLELANSGQKVIMLEAGSMQKTEISQSFYDLENASLPMDANSRIRTFGGTTTVWGGGWKPLDPIDVERRDWVPFSGWPLTRETLIPYYERGAKIFSGPALGDFEIGNLGELFRNKFILNSDKIKTTLLRILPRGKWNFAESYREFFESNTSVEVFFNAPVTKILLDHTQRKVVQVNVQTTLGKKLVIRAKNFVVACGGIENARLLLFSEIGNGYDQVGRYYMDHPKLVSGVFVPKKRNLDLSLYWKTQDVKGVAIAGLQLSESSQRSLLVLNSYAGLTLSRSVMDWFAGGKEFKLKNFIEQAPRPENRISLGSKTDMFGNPLTKTEWLLSDIDKKSLFGLHVVLKEEFKLHNLGDLSSPILENTETFASIRDASHHMGTTRMGLDPKYSVVDENCRIHDVTNLFIAGSSVFPTSGNANPTATIIALAIRLADHMRSL